MEDEYNVVIDALQTKLNALEKMQKGCDNLNSSIGGGMGLMDCIRYGQMDELREAIKREKALAHVKETPKNEHDSDDVLNKSGNVDMMREALRKALSALETCQPEDTSTGHVIYCSFDNYEVKGAIQAIEKVLAAEPASLVRLTDEEIDKCYGPATRTFKRFKYSVRGQIIMPQDSFEWHFANAIMDAMQEKNK